MRYSRIQSYVQKYRKKEYDFRTRESGFAWVSDISELLPPDMSDMKIKLEGYQLSEMNFFELTTILDNEFTKAFTEHRLIDSKKISNERLKKTQAELAKKVGSPPSYVNRLIKKPEKIAYLQMMEQLGYDIEITYTKK